ncbi:MAG: carboxymuconolactone decarboxylase family protein [Lautropia sp.]
MSATQRAVANEIAAGPRGSVRGPFLPLLHNPELARRLQAVGEYLRYRTGLDDTLVELAILVTARRFTCQYEWHAHEKLARKAGLAGSIIDAVAVGRTPAAMSDDEALVHAFAVEALSRGEPSDASFEAARSRFGLERVLSLLAICGYYSTLALVLNTARMALPDGAAPPLQPIAGTGDTP